MHRISRRTVIAGAVGFHVAGCGETVRPAFAYKLATNQTLSHPLNIRIIEATHRIREATQGAVSIQVFPNGQLGADTGMLGQLRADAIQFQAIAGVILSTYAPLSSLNGVGFAFSSDAQVFAAMDNKLGALIRADIASRGLYAFEKIFDNGFRHITTSALPIQEPRDLSALKIRVPPGAMWTSMFRAFGAAPTSINFNEVYSALQTRVVDGQENPLAIIDSAKIFEVQKHCCLSSHMWDGFWLLANAKAMERLPPDMQLVVRREFERAALDQRQDLATLNLKLRESLAARGMEFVEPDTALFRRTLRESGFYTDWKDRFGRDAWAVLEEYSGNLL
jgi:tripartite ATP-independent transporter DctP family solute receptor